MKELNFLKKLKRKGVIELVESSEEMKSSYLIKAENCLKSAKILCQSHAYLFVYASPIKIYRYF